MTLQIGDTDRNMPDTHTLEASSDSSVVYHIAPKIPNFWADDPELFFIRVEAEFSKAHPKITAEQTKFSYLVGSLDKDHAMLVRSQLVSPDSTEPYSALKRELIRQFTLPEHSRLALAQAETLSGKKRSNLLCRLSKIQCQLRFLHIF